jgi:hypothetical protein
MVGAEDGDDVRPQAYKFADELFQIIGDQTDLELPDQITVLISVLIGVSANRPLSGRTSPFDILGRVVLEPQAQSSGSRYRRRHSNSGIAALRQMHARMNASVSPIC